VTPNRIGGTPLRARMHEHTHEVLNGEQPFA